jgi:hypothetical protein
MPGTEPDPQRPVPATAIVDHVATITELGDERGSDKGIPLLHPYQVVEFKFVPPGMDIPVTAVDKVDQNSVPGLQDGQTVPIVYDAGHPRVARLQGGTRMFPAQARRTVLYIGIAFAVLVSIPIAIQAFARTARRRLGF